MGKLERWAERERAKLIATRRPSALSRLDYIADQLQTIEALSDGLAEVEELVTRIQEMFGESRGPAVVLSTVHKAKGLEADRVFVLTDTLYCGGNRQTQEEQNIHYVAVTRAKQTLVLVSKEM
jgi:DNA helicase-2/ATP-dependent DNA helicase PcrA